ncbi:MAG: protein TolQ [Nitrosomonadales bacterium]|nr:protein TolQ [Nitrosomonadales bacterium]
MEVTKDLSFVHLITNASLLVQIVMGMLLLVSLMSWWYIFQKMFVVRLAGKQSVIFEQAFWANGDLTQLYQNAVSSREAAGSMERIFAAGYAEFIKLKKNGSKDSGAVMDGVRRAMNATYQREMDQLESHLSFLATVGSVSPYVGLFGTVWGIMNAFRGLANVGQATLAHVAPGIAEALVATAMGLFAAIPAVVAYNRYSHEVGRLSSRFESFMEEFSNVLQRQL